MINYMNLKKNKLKIDKKFFLDIESMSGQKLSIVIFFFL